MKNPHALYFFFKNSRTFLLGILLFLPISGLGQTPYDWPQFVEEYTQDLQNDDTDPEKLQEELSTLEFLHQNPLNLNEVNQEDLETFPFLSSSQIEDILKYRDRHNPILSTKELSLIPSLSFQTRKFLTLFLVCRTPATSPKKDLLHQLFKGKHEITTRLDIPFYTRDGFKNNSELEKNQKYLGDKLYTSLRYRYNNGDTLLYGLTAEKDAGEPFASRGNFLYDSYSFYFYLRQRQKPLTIALGDYRIHFGEGLIIGNGFMLNHTTILDSYNRPNSPIKPHTGIAESNYFRGFAGRYKGERITLTVFGAYTPMDAILRGDTVISSFKTDGYHRTPLEQSRRGNIKNITYGTDFNLSLPHWNIGLSGIYTHYDKAIVPGDRNYNRYALRGKQFKAASLHYQMAYRPFSTQGEIALSDNKGYALLNTIRYSPVRNLQLISIQRSYSIRFHSPFGYTFKAGSRIQNEQGIYTGLRADLSYKWNVKAYVDWYRYPWSTYLYSSPSHGLAYMVEANYQANAISTFSAQYRNKSHRYKNSENLQQTPENHLMRLCATFSPSFFTLQTVLKHAIITTSNQPSSKGWLLSERIGFNKSTWHLNGLMAYFHTDDYSSRLYQYTPNVVYANTSTMLYGHGFCCVGMGRVLIKQRLELSCRYGFILYFNRSSIGSGAQRINSSSQNDLTLQLRYRL